MLTIINDVNIMVGNKNESQSHYIKYKKKQIKISKKRGGKNDLKKKEFKYNNEIIMSSFK